MKYKIIKVSQGYKIKSAEFSLLRLFSFLNKESSYLKDIKNKSDKVTSDLIFKDKACAELYLLKNYDQQNILSNRILAGICQLKEIFSHAKIQPQSYRWADCWSGSGIWSLALVSLGLDEVFCVDNSFPYDLEVGLTSNSQIKILTLDTTKEKLPIEVNAIFLRSSFSPKSIMEIMELNPQVELFIMIPEGLNDNDGVINSIQKEHSNYQRYYREVDIRNLNSDLCLKGSTSRGIRFNRDFPVIICQGRK